MKKSVMRGSMLAVAALSLMLGGTSYTTSVKDQVTQTPAIISKAIENSVADTDAMEKGTVVRETAQVAKEEKTEKTTKENQSVQSDVNEIQVAEQTAQAQVPQVEQKEAKVESNQVVANITSYLNIREEASIDAEVVGKFYSGNVGTIIEKGDEWSLVASGNAYGYVNNDYLLFGEDAENYIENNCDQVAKVNTETLNIRAEESTDSDVIELSDEGDKLTILGNEGDWIKVAVSDDKVGYVASDYVYIDYVYGTAVTIEEERAAEEAARAEAEAEAEAEAAAAAAEEEAQTVTETQEPATEAPQTTAPVTEAPQPVTEAPVEQETVDSTDVVVSDEGSATESVQQESTSSTGQEIANYACQFVGNPYVYGGTSLTNGADCSGFVQSVYKNFGYSLPRVAADQAGAGRSVSVDSLQPGDLLFYHGFGHVAIYIGGGQVVHASNAATGIKISAYNYSPIDKAVRIVQ